MHKAVLSKTVLSYIFARGKNKKERYGAGDEGVKNYLLTYRKTKHKLILGLEKDLEPIGQLTS